MEIWSYITAKSKSSALMVLLMFLCLYFMYFGIKGDRGILKYQALQEQITAAEKLNRHYDEKRQALEEKVKLLSSSSLDLDMLDERARAVLNVIGDKEFIIIDEDDEELN